MWWSMKDKIEGQFMTYGSDWLEHSPYMGVIDWSMLSIYKYMMVNERQDGRTTSIGVIDWSMLSICKNMMVNKRQDRRTIHDIWE